MVNQKHTYPVGNGRTLALEVDPASGDEVHFAEECRLVAATNPGSIHDFFCRLADLQRQQAGANAHERNAPHQQQQNHF